MTAERAIQVVFTAILMFGIACGSYCVKVEAAAIRINLADRFQSTLACAPYGHCEAAK